MNLQSDEILKITNYIESVKWKFAVTMPKWPHWYTVYEWDLDKYNEFLYFVEYIRKYGYSQKFYKKELIYFNIGEYKYWTMGNPITETKLINRAKL